MSFVLSQPRPASKTLAKRNAWRGELKGSSSAAFEVGVGRSKAVVVSALAAGTDHEMVPDPFSAIRLDGTAAHRRCVVTPGRAPVIDPFFSATDRLPANSHYRNGPQRHGRKRLRKPRATGILPKDRSAQATEIARQSNQHGKLRISGRDLPGKFLFAHRPCLSREQDDPYRQELKNEKIQCDRFSGRILVPPLLPFLR